MDARTGAENPEQIVRCLEARGLKPPACRRGHDSNFWLLTSSFCFKNEGASGDVHENKGTGKNASAKCQERCLEARGLKPAACKRGHDSNFWLLTSSFCFQNERASGDLYENK